MTKLYEKDRRHFSTLLWTILSFSLSPKSHLEFHVLYANMQVRRSPRETFVSKHVLEAARFTRDLAQTPLRCIWHFLCGETNILHAVVEVLHLIADTYNICKTLILGHLNIAHKLNRRRNMAFLLNALRAQDWTLRQDFVGGSRYIIGCVKRVLVMPECNETGGYS